MPYMRMDHQIDPADDLIARLGDISDVKIFNNQVLMALYVRPMKTKSGIYLSDKTRDEDIFQSKVGLIVKVGESAFSDPNGNWFNGESIKIHDWVVSRPSDGWSIVIKDVHCRIISDINIKAAISHPDDVW